MRSFRHLAAILLPISLVTSIPAMAIVETVVPLNGTGPSSKPSGSDESEIPFMERKLPEVRFDNAPLGDVLEFLSDVTGGRVEVDWKALEAAGYPRTEPISGRLRDVKLSKALETIFRDVSGRNNKPLLAYDYSQGTVKISTLMNLMTTVKYDVSDLLAMVPVFPQYGTVSEQLMWIVREKVDRPSWDRTEAPATIRVEGNDLIVRQLPKEHEEIQHLLDALRDRSRSQPAFVPRPTTRPAPSSPNKSMPDGKHSP